MDHFSEWADDEAITIDEGAFDTVIGEQRSNFGDIRSNLR